MSQGERLRVLGSPEASAASLRFLIYIQLLHLSLTTEEENTVPFLPISLTKYAGKFIQQRQKKKKETCGEKLGF